MDPKPATILIVEDHPTARRFLADNLAGDGYEPVEADSAREGRRLMATKAPDLAIIDLCLPDRDGLERLRDVRQADPLLTRLDPNVPLFVLSGRASELDRLRGFERGCDDYLVKPFSYPELRGRVAALLRRTNRRPGMGRLRAGDLEIDPPSRTVILRGKRLDVSQKEFALLRTLATEPTRVFSKEELLRTVWGFRSMGISLLKVP